MDWCSPQAFDSAVLQRALSRKVLVVPNLIGYQEEFKCLRIKIVDRRERNRLRQWVSNIPGKFQKATSQCGNVEFYFGSEQYDLDHHHSLGVLVSFWARDPRVTKGELQYTFPEDCLEVFGTGYGSRETAECVGSNVYLKPQGRGTKRTRTSPFQAPEEIELQQYHRKCFQNHLLQPSVRKVINDLSFNVLSFARSSNHYYMQLVNRICTRQILTTGNVQLFVKWKLKTCCSILILIFDYSIAYRKCPKEIL